MRTTSSLLAAELLLLSLLCSTTTTLIFCQGHMRIQQQPYHHRIRRFWKIRGGEESYPPPPGYEDEDQKLYQQQQQQQEQQQQRYEGPDLPPDLPPPYGEESRQQQQQQQQQQFPDQYDQQRLAQDYSQYQQQQQRQYQQYQSSPPPLPPGAYGGDPQQQQQQQHSLGPPPLPDSGYEGSYGSHNGMMMDPPFPPNDSSFFQDDEASGLDLNVFGVGTDNRNLNDPSSTAPGGMDLSSFDKEYILRGLARLYRKKILPLEISSRYGHFHSPPLSPADFVAPPMVLLLGQYSVGKTSFIKYLVGRDFPGIRVGPEPTTDRFTAVLWGSSDKIVPGAALCSQSDRPFTGLGPYGNNFLSKFEGVELDTPVLRNVTLVDTPGILSGQKQRARNYDYESVMKWFGERADLVIVMFDAHKLDISDELKRVMEIFIPHMDKIRIVLNKADSISTQQLMRVYGALMWSLGKVMNTPEVSRVYMGSFWDAPLANTEQADLLQREEMDLLQDIMGLPQQAVMRRINELVKRARSVKVHAYIIHYLRKQLPYTWGKKEKQRRLIDRLDAEFAAAARRYGLPKGDFPPLEPFRRALLEIQDLSEFPKLDKKLVREMDKVFSVEIPDLLDQARNHR